MIISSRVMCVIKDKKTKYLFCCFFIFIKEKKIEPYYMLYMERHLSIKLFFVIFVLLQDVYKIKLNSLIHCHWTSVQQNCTLEWGDYFSLLVNPHWVSHSHKEVLYIGAQPSEWPVDKWLPKNRNIIPVDLKPQGHWESNVNTHCLATRYYPLLQGKYLEAN